MPTNNERKMEKCTDLTLLLHIRVRNRGSDAPSIRRLGTPAKVTYVLWNTVTLGRGRKRFAGACRIDCRAFDWRDREGSRERGEVGAPVDYSLGFGARVSELEWMLYKRTCDEVFDGCGDALTEL